MQPRLFPVIHCSLLTCVLAVLPSSRSNAALGMTAPPLRVAHWIQGRPVKLDAAMDSRVIVVEFWATWCAPCKESIPHLSALQSRFSSKGVTVIGITDEPPDVVKPFVRKMGDKMNYTVASDDGKSTWKAYMDAFGEDGIPHAFIINQKGKIAWHGHPMDGLEDTLAAVVSGKHDLDLAVFQEDFRERVHDYLHLASDGDSPLARAAGRKLLEDGAKHPDLLNDLAWEILTHEDGLQFRDKELAVEAARLANEVSGGRDASILDTYARALFETGRAGDAVRVQSLAVKHCTDAETRGRFEARLKSYQAGADKTPAAPK